MPTAREIIKLFTIQYKYRPKQIRHFSTVGGPKPKFLATWYLKRWLIISNLCMVAEFGPKRSWNFSPNPARKARPDLVTTLVQPVTKTNETDISVLHKKYTFVRGEIL